MKTLIRILSGTLFALVLVIVIGAVIINNVTTAPLPQHTGEIKAAGLSAPVEVLRDRYGVPHIYASTPYDLFFAQGFTQAQDRWWQMAFSRAIGSGRVQELTGGNASALSSDLFIRTIGWRRAAQREYDSVMTDETKQYLKAFADGVNAYITSRPAGSLAFEYTLLSVTGVTIPLEPWTPVDSIVWGKVMAWDLSDQLDDLVTQQWRDALTPEQFAQLMPAYPYDFMPTIVEAADLPVQERAPLPTAQTGTTVSGLSPAAFELAGSVPPDIRFAFGEGEGLGSNNWVIAGSRTDSGTPILANDPHLGIQMPSIWYEVGLHCQPVTDACPFDVRGYAFVPTPGVVIGHNANIAWGFTNVGPDVMDLYRIQTVEGNPLQYVYDGEVRDMTVHEEVIRVGDGDTTYTIQVRETHLGPIMNDNRIGEDGQPSGFNPEPIALRWTAHDPTQLYTAIIGLNTASNYAEFREAMSYFAVPAQNVVYADIEGNIAYQTPGLMPIRPAGVAGDSILDGSTSATAWQGYIPYDLLPRVLNPERGWIHSANQDVVLPEYYEQLMAQLEPEFGTDINPRLGLYFDYGYRGSRIVELLEATTLHTIDSVKTIQTDARMTGFEVFRPHFEALALEDGSDLDRARDLLMAWDLQADLDSPEAAIWASTWRQLVDIVFNDTLNAADVEATGVGTRTIWAATQLLETPEDAWWDDVRTTDTTERRDDALRLALQRGLAAGAGTHGADFSAWRWGDWHTATFISNPLGVSGVDLVENIVNRTVRAPGSSDTVNAASWNLETFEMQAGASFRMIAKLPDWDNSQNMNTTGQSGHPFSPHYADLLPLWSTGQYKPMLFTRSAVEAGAVARLTLVP
ncbi:MAG: penicillin acylase family protein [Anaerolineae bacterium]|nr:penicillin acylase family protein [Anaerolineae bacterium]